MIKKERESRIAFDNCDVCNGRGVDKITIIEDTNIKYFNRSFKLCKKCQDRLIEVLKEDEQ